MNDADLALKLKCLEIAAMELLETKGFIKQAELMRRGKQLYLEAKIQGFSNWDMPEPKPAPTPTPIEEEKLVPDSDTKICPNCQEVVPIKFKKHKFRKDGSVCGYVWG